MTAQRSVRITPGIRSKDARYTHHELRVSNCHLGMLIPDPRQFLYCRNRFQPRWEFRKRGNGVFDGIRRLVSDLGSSGQRWEESFAMTLMSDVSRESQRVGGVRLGAVHTGDTRPVCHVSGSYYQRATTRAPLIPWDVGPGPGFPTMGVRFAAVTLEWRSGWNSSGALDRTSPTYGYFRR